MDEKPHVASTLPIVKAPHQSRISSKPQQATTPEVVISPLNIPMNHRDPMLTYANDIHAMLRKTENKYRPTTNYMPTSQNDVNEKMRSILIDWLIEVHMKLKCFPETLYLTVSLIDRYLS